jgi:hypothetical protein
LKGLYDELHVFIIQGKAMKTIMTAVEMIAFHNKEGIPHPVRLKYPDDGDTVILNINYQTTLNKQ